MHQIKLTKITREWAYLYEIAVCSNKQKSELQEKKTKIVETQCLIQSQEGVPISWVPTEKLSSTMKLNHILTNTKLCLQFDLYHMRELPIDKADKILNQLLTEVYFLLYLYKYNVEEKLCLRFYNLVRIKSGRQWNILKCKGIKHQLIDENLGSKKYLCCLLAKK